MSSKQYYTTHTLKDGMRAENERTNEDVLLISKIDCFADVWIVSGSDENLYLEWEYNLCNPFYYD